MQLASGSQAAVDGGHEYILADRGTLPSLWGVLIDQFDQPKLAGEIVEGGNAAKLGDPSPEWLGLRMLELFQQGIGRTQILEDDWTGPSIDAARFDDVVIGAPVDDFALDAGHSI